MMALVDLITGLAELWCSWRLYLCLIVAAGLAAALHHFFPETMWMWFVSVPTVVAGFVLGFRWQVRADERSSPPKGDWN